MKYLNAIYQFFRVIRWQNLLMIAAIQFALYYVIILKLYNLVGVEAALKPILLALLSTTTILIAGAGYIINDYFDMVADRINKPDGMILGKTISRKTGFRLYLILNSIAILTGFYLAYVAGSWRLGLLFPMIIILLWLYSLKYKKMQIWGNVAVAIMAAFVILIVWLFEFFMLRLYPDDFVKIVPFLGLITKYFVIFGIFAFMLTLVREILKDAEDIAGDERAGMRTFAVERGVDASVKLALILTSASILFLLYIAVFFFINRMNIPGIYYSVAVVFPLIWFLFKVYKANSKSDFHFLSIAIKIVMLAGIIGLQPISMSL